MWNNNMGLNLYSKHKWMGKWMILPCDFSVPWFWTNPSVVLIQSTLCTIKPQREVDDNTLFPTQYLLHITSHQLGNRFAAFPHGPLALIRNWLLLALSHDSTETAGVVQFYGPQQRPTALLEELSDPPGHQLARWEPAGHENCDSNSDLRFRNS